MTQEPEHTLGPVMRLTAQWRHGGAWLGPTWALLCGVFASRQFQFSGNQIVGVLVALIVAAGLWPTLWAALAETDWRAPLQRWRVWNEGRPVKTLPYTQPGSPSEHLSILLGQCRDWAARDLLPGYGNALFSIILAPLAALILAAMLGAPAVLVTIAAICIPQAAVLLNGGNGASSPLLRGMLEIALPLLLGVALLAPLSAEMVIVAVGFGVAFAGASGSGDRAALIAWNLGQAVVFGLLVLTRHPIGAFAVGLLWLPQFMLQAQPDARRAQWWLMASLLVAAVTAL
ncbi:MAG: hypothetical protein M1140_04010 [Chloroflexi bacterium]|nr:hypothetical protein [Chloroflexota bacterium]